MGVAIPGSGPHGGKEGPELAYWFEWFGSEVHHV
jgi:hypothetical protein